MNLKHSITTLRHNIATLRVGEFANALSLLAVALLAGVESHAGQRLPRVVVSVAIDGLRTDMLEAFMPLYGEGGFRLLMNRGSVYSNADYPAYEPNRASSVATLATGSVPYDHGILDLHWLSRSTLRPVFCVEDSRQQGLNTTEQLSPCKLAVSTLGDELKVSTGGQGLVYSFAPFSDAAILGAGHAADGAYWLDDKSNLWAGTTYYSASLPAWVEAVNSRLRSEQPSPTVSVNSRVADMAASCFRYTTVGNDEVPDYIALTLTALQPEQTASSAYVELDQTLSTIISAAENTVGSDNALIIVTSTGTAEPEAANLDAYRIPTGNFYIDRTANLLNMMLMAVYGEGNYVEAIYDNQIYLNHKLIEQKQLSMAEVLDRCQELLLQSEGVKDAYSSQRLMLGAWTPDISRLRNSYNPRLSGDILVQVAPGWQLVNETAKYSKPVRESCVSFPIILYGLDVEAREVRTPVTTDCIAPTLAGFMRIRAPNACRSSALP